MPKSPTSPARSLAIELLGTCHSISDTARRVGVHRKTIARWLVQPKFSGRVRKRLDRFKHDHTAALFRNIPRAIRTLKRNLCDTDNPAAGNAAAKIILTRAGLLTPDAPPRDEARIEEVSLGGSLVVMTPAEAAKLAGGENVIVIIPDTDSASHADHPSGPRQDPEAHRPPA